MIKKYNKLVRDKIPKIIEENGQMCETEILSDERYLEMLELKLSEECTEYQIDKNTEALADILEGVENILAQLAVEQRRLGRGIIFEFARLRAELRDLALIDDDHALAVGDGDHRAVGNDVV